MLTYLGIDHLSGPLGFREEQGFLSKCIPWLHQILLSILIVSRIVSQFLQISLYQIISMRFFMIKPTYPL